MSRSYRHISIHGITTCRSEKDDKRRDHRLQRARLRMLLSHERYEDAEVNGPGLNRWSRGKDGKVYRTYPTIQWQNHGDCDENNESHAVPTLREARYFSLGWCQWRWRRMMRK